MSAKVKSSKKSVKVEEIEVTSETEVKPKKSTKKTNKSMTEEVELVSDSDKSFLELLDKKPDPEPKENENENLENDNLKIPKNTNKISKMISLTNQKILKINKLDFNEYEIDEEEKNTIFNNINDLISFTQFLHKKYTAYLCGNKLESDELVSNKKGKKVKKEKKVLLDEEGNPIKKDTSNNYINTKHLPYIAVNDFMGDEHGTLVSPLEVQSSLRKFIKEQKELGNEDNVTGKLKTLLEFIIPQRIQIDDSGVNIIPTKINNTKDIITYGAWCFPLMNKPKKGKASKTDDK
jgi:hypothetical protein